jgi:hypothetical protein
MVGAATALLLTGCGALSHDGPAVAHGVEDAVVGAAHDHVKVELPGVPRAPVDLGDLRLSLLQAQVHSIFGDETKENVEIVCKAKEFVELGATNSSEDAIRRSLALLGIQRPEDEITQLAQETTRAVESGLSPNELSRAAVVWACQWAGS